MGPGPSMCVLRECRCQANVSQDTQALTGIEENSKKWNLSFSLPGWLVLEHFLKQDCFPG